MEGLTLREYFEQFNAQWTERLGTTGESLARDLSQLVDLILEEHKSILEEIVKERGGELGTL